MMFDVVLARGQLRFVTNNLYMLDDKSYDFVLEKGDVVIVLDAKTEGNVWDEYVRVLTFRGPRKVNSGWLVSQTMNYEY